MEEVHADAQPILDAVATRVANDQLARCLIEVIGDEQCWMVMPQPGDGDLTDRSLIAAELHRLLNVADLLVTAIGRVDDCLFPIRDGRCSRRRMIAAPRRRMVTKWIP